MAGPRVIQDSDESDSELSDTASSIDPLQDQEHPPAHTRDDNGQVEESNDVPPDHGGMVTESSEPVVNFDRFLAMQSQDGTLVTASQKQREELWIGGVADNVGEFSSESEGFGLYRSDVAMFYLGARSASADISSLNRGFGSPSSKPPFSAETPDTTMLKRRKTMGPPDNIDKLKRRRTSDLDDSFRTMHYNHTQESSFDIFATTGTTSSVYGPSGQFSTEVYNMNSSLHQQIAPAPTSEQSTTMQMLHVEIPQQTSSNVPSTHGSLDRSKSMPPEPDSSHDTEPMSSITFARARRAITDFVDAQQQMPFDANPDELAIPVSVDPSTFESTMKSKNGARTPGHASSDEDEIASEYHGGISKELYDPKSKLQESMEPVEAKPEPETKDIPSSQNHVPNNQDELNSEVLCGMPKELYQPRPSRSRSKLQEPVKVTEDEPEPEDKETFRFEDHVYNNRDEPDFAHMPKEIYNPTPSRSRSKPQETVETIEVEPETKGKKRYSSPDHGNGHDHITLNSDDFGGMPKEHYKPRPSRSRSKRSDLVYIDQDVHKGRDPGLAVVIPQEATVERVRQAEQKRVSKIKSEPVDEDSQEVQSISNGSHEEPVDEADPIDTIAAQDVEILIPEPPAPARKGRKRKGTVDYVATSRANSIVPEKPARKKRGKSKKKAAGSPVAEPIIVPDTEGPFNEATKSVATKSREPQADYDPITSRQQQHPEETTALSNNPQPDLEDSPNRHPSPQPQPQSPSENVQQKQGTAPSTPKKQPEPPTTPAKVEKGPDKHSPISIRNKVPYRVGLSRRARIAPLLKVVRK